MTATSLLARANKFRAPTGECVNGKIKAHQMKAQTHIARARAHIETSLPVKFIIFPFENVSGKSDRWDATEPAMKTNHRLKNNHGPGINPNQGYTFTSLRRFVRGRCTPHD